MKHGGPHRRHQRFGRRPHPGGRGLPLRLRRDLLPQHAGLRRDPADFRPGGAERGRRRLLAGSDRLRLHGEGHRQDVHHRAGRDQGRHRRGDLRRGSGRRHGAQPAVGQRSLCVRHGGGAVRDTARPALLPPAKQRGGPAADGHRRRSPADGRRADPAGADHPHQALRHAGSHRQGGGPRATSSRCTGISRRTSWSALRG